MVLNEDYLDVSEDDIRHLRSVLTLLEGSVVYSDPDITLTGADALKF